MWTYGQRCASAVQPEHRPIPSLKGGGAMSLEKINEAMSRHFNIFKYLQYTLHWSTTCDCITTQVSGATPPSQIVPKQTAKCSLLGCQAAGQRPSSSGHKGADAMASSILVSLQKALMDISPQWGSHAAVFMFPKEYDV